MRPASTKPLGGRPQVKICGLTRREDARLAASLGATHVGAVMVPASPRCATIEQAGVMFEAAGDGVQHVLVFKRLPPETILEVARDVGTTHVQLHGASEEDALELEQAGMTVYRVHRMEPGSRLLPSLIPEPREDRPAVLDVGGGGSGQAFCWEILGGRAPHATFIAGGIGPGNIAALLRHRPYGVDLSSSVESKPGVKDPHRLRLFFERLDEAL